MNFVDGIEIGGIHAYPGSPFGVPYSRAEKVYDISAAGSSVKLYLFSADNGYDAVVRGNGAIANYLYTEATSTNSHTDDRPYDAETITRMYIEDGITSIGNYFMYKAFNLKSLTFANIGAITHLGTNAFAYTQIDGEYNFSGLTDTKLDAPFMVCPKLNGVTFGRTITEIEKKSFLLCIALKYVTGISAVTTIGDMAFHYCAALESIDVIPDNTSLGNWVFMITPTDAVIEGTYTALSDAVWKGQGSICFVPKEWTTEQLIAIREVTGDSVQFPIPESDNQGTDFYDKWLLFPAVIAGKYWGVAHPASGSCGIFSLFHIYNLLHPNAQYDTFYDFITKEIAPRKIKVTQSLYDALISCEYGQLLIQGNTSVSYEVGSNITAMDLPAALDDDAKTYGDKGTSFWGVCEALGWTGNKIMFENGINSGATVKRAILDSLVAGKPVMMEIVAATDTTHGAHAVVAMGYDAKTDRLLIIDSAWSYPSDIVPLVYWCSFESLITPDAASTVWTFDFGEVTNMKSVNDKLDIIIQSASFRIESGKIELNSDVIPSDGKFKIQCSNGAKLLAFHADSKTLAEIKASSGTYYTASVIGNCFAPKIANYKGSGISYAAVMFEYIYGGNSYGWMLGDESTSVNNTDGLIINVQALKEGTYYWKAYYWDDKEE